MDFSLEAGLENFFACNSNQRIYKTLQGVQSQRKILDFARKTVSLFKLLERISALQLMAYGISGLIDAACRN
jgi:hypothetical protein